MTESNETMFRYRRTVANDLTDEVLVQTELPDLRKHREAKDWVEQVDGKVDLDLLDALFDHALERDEDPIELDAWLAPRLHNVVRISPRIASDDGFWKWLALEHGRQYVKHRFGSVENPDTVRQWRFTGTWSRNALSRLWWGAEMTRNGPDYEIVPRTFARVRTAQFALELKYSWYRPAAIAFVTVTEGLDGGEKLPDGGNDLSTRINALTTLRPVEGIGASQPLDGYDSDWRLHVPSLDNVTATNLPSGPNDGLADQSAIDALVKWFREIAPDAAV